MRGSDDRIADAELIVSEAVGNAVRHTGGPVWVSLAWSTELPVLRVYDIGPGFDTDDLPAPATAAMAGGTLDEHGGDDLDDGVLLVDSGRGLLIIQALAPEVSAAVRANAGMVVSATLPVPRRRTASLDPPRLRTNVLPSMEEVRPEGGFGKESFLRVLDVQLPGHRDDPRPRRRGGGGGPGRRRRQLADGGGVPTRPSGSSAG